MYYSQMLNVNRKKNQLNSVYITYPIYVILNGSFFENNIEILILQRLLITVNDYIFLFVCF